MMPDEEARVLKQKQDEVMERLKLIKHPIKICILDKEFIVNPGVFSSQWGDTVLLASVVRQETKKSDSVLDMGTGAGIQAIFAAEKSSNNILAVDINPKAVECALENAERLGLKNEIAVFESDLFSKVTGNFDLIIYNPPFRWFKARDMLERSTTDENYNSMKNFLANAKNYLKANGRILIVFSTTGDLKYFETLIRKYEYGSEILATDEEPDRKYNVYKLIPNS
ncbi:MAG: methyltransferase [Candidatus Aenigmatarchaeota archaeon]